MAELGIALGYQPGNPNVIGELARAAEDAGFAGTFAAEGGTNNGLLCCFIMAQATQRVGIYTWITNIHYRLPILCAGTAMMVQDAAQGRFVLGLGVSHRPAMEAMGVQVANNRDKLRSYAQTVRQIFRGELPAAAARRALTPPKYPIPIYFSALSVETARLAGEMADGLMLLMCTPERVRRLADAAAESARSHGRKPADVKITAGAPVFMHNDLNRAYEAARAALVPYAMLPFYRRQWVRSGFEAETQAVVAAAERGDAAGQRAAISNRLIDSIALVGPAERCLERMAAFEATGADVVVLSPRPVEGDQALASRHTIEAIAKRR